MQTAELSPAARIMHAAIARDIVKEMADVMRARPGCTFEDLRAEGFTSRQIDRYREQAAVVASRLSVRRVA
jgi:hypothetical protein